jgi:tetratricopeptide (TPR) repeat protein
MNGDWDFHGAEASCARALELAPGNATALRMAGTLALFLGRFEDGIALQRRAIEQDPLSAASYDNLGWALHSADRFAEAEAAYRKALELASQGVGTHAKLSLILLAQSKGEEALTEALRESDEAVRLWALAIVHHALGHRPESDAALDQLRDKYAEDWAYQIAEVYSARGEADAAIEWLERAYVQRDSGLTGMIMDTQLRSLHGDPRWGAFLKKVGLER